MNMNMAFNLQDVAILFSDNYCNIFYLLALCSTFCFYALVTERRPRLPPGPRGLPLLGNLPFLQPDLHRQLAKLSETYGPIIKLQLGRKLSVVINSPSLAKQVLQGPTFTNRDPSRAALVGFYGGADIAWRNSGPEWRNLRRIVSHELLGHESLRECFQFCRREVRLMVKELHGKAGSTVDVGEEVMGTLLNILMSMFWGSSLSSEEDERVRAECKNAIEEFVGLLGEFNVSDYFPFLAKLDLQGVEPRMKKASLWFDHVFEAAIASKKKNSAGNRDFLQVLLECSLPVEQAKGVLVDIILPGTYGPLVTTEWAITRLLRNPDQMRRVQEELDTIIGPQSIVADSHLEKLVYLKAVMQEVLRLHPTVPLLIPHTPTEPTSLSGYTIPQGCWLMFNVWAMQRDPKAWDNPLEFEPERFLKNPGGEYDFQGNSFNYMPFGSGRRVCVGIPLAEKMTLYILATLLHSFEWRSPDGVEPDLGEKYGIVVKKDKPLVVIPVPRLQSTNQYI